MLYHYYTEKLLGLEGVLIKKAFNNTKTLSIMIELPRKIHICPCCQNKTNKIHDFRIQVSKDIPAFGKPTILILRKRRYVCPDCGKCFFEKNTWLPRYHRVTNRLVGYIIHRLSDVHSFTSVAKDTNLSVSTIIRFFDIVGTPKVVMPKVLSIDEFKGNTDGEKYQCIITDPVNKRIIDILPMRYKHKLTEYFTKFNRSKTAYFVSDMWETYRDISKSFFKNATFVVDKYHFIRQVIWAFEAVRKEEQKRFANARRKYFKHSKSLLNKQYKYLTLKQKQEVDVMLHASERLLTAYSLKELYFDFLAADNSKDAKKLLSQWILAASSSNIPSFVNCSNTTKNH